ncbi:hypothetical protein MHYP_G00076510 [Metynnis hypsauchen]
MPFSSYLSLPSPETAKSVSLTMDTLIKLLLRWNHGRRKDESRSLAKLSTGTRRKDPWGFAHLRERERARLRHLTAAAGQAKASRDSGK